jgi:hypothetical protein
MDQMTGKDYGLLPAPNRCIAASEPAAPLRLVKPCDGSYTCSCEKCERDKVRVSGGRSSLPWEQDHQAAA